MKTMSSTEVKKIEQKIDRVEKKLDLVIRQLAIYHQQESDWLDDPALVRVLDEIAVPEPSMAKKDVAF